MTKYNITTDCKGARPDSSYDNNTTAPVVRRYQVVVVVVGAGVVAVVELGSVIVEVVVFVKLVSTGSDQFTSQSRKSMDVVVDVVVDLVVDVDVVVLVLVEVGPTSTRMTAFLA